MILDSELILNPDGSIFHLHLKPRQVADTVILVDDPKLMSVIESLFTEIEHNIANREYVSMTESYNQKRITSIY